MGGTAMARFRQSVVINQPVERLFAFAGLIYELWAVPPPGSAELLRFVTDVAAEPERGGAPIRSAMPATNETAACTR
jgi:hypothetical protein